MAKQAAIEQDGTIVEALSNAMFRVELENGVDITAHISGKMRMHYIKILPGDKVKVKVLEIDEERRRISLGLKQCKPNPWKLFDENHKKGDRVTGKIKSITDFGIFIGLEGGIDGLVHLTDLSHTESSEDAAAKFKKGDEITAVVLQVDADRERISLGVKQLEEDPFSRYAGDPAKKGKVVTGTVKSVDARGAVIELEEGVEGYIRASDAARDRVEDATTEHITTISYMVRNKLIADEDGCESGASLEHFAHIRHVCSVEVAEVERGESAAIIEHTAHTLHLRCVEAGEVE